MEIQLCPGHILHHCYKIVGYDRGREYLVTVYPNLRAFETRGATYAFSSVRWSPASSRASILTPASLDKVSCDPDERYEGIGVRDVLNIRSAIRRNSRLHQLLFLRRDANIGLQINTLSTGFHDGFMCGDPAFFR